MRRRALVTGLLALAGCGPRRLPPPPRAPKPSAAAELIPADLDVVVRLDLGRMKSALGALTPERLSQDVLARTAGASGDEPDALIVESLLAAELVYLGYRPNERMLPLDRVLALQGRFEPLTRPRGFSGPVDLGGDVRYWELPPGAPKPARSGSARLYAIGDRVRAFVSEAEIDAVERALEGLPGPRPLSAPEEGSLSLALRPRLLARLTRGTLSELLGEAKSLQVVIELESDGAKLVLTLIAADAEQAARLGEAGKDVLGRALGERAGKASLTVVADRLSLVVRASREELAGALGCWQRDAGSATLCPW